MLGVAVASSRSSELGLEVHQGLLPVQREMKPGGTCLRCHLLRSIEVLSWTCFGLAALLLAQRIWENRPSSGPLQTPGRKSVVCDQALSPTPSLKPSWPSYFWSLPV